MLRHIVLFKIRENIPDKGKTASTLKDKLERIKDQIPEVKKLETGINVSTQPNAYDLALVTEFNDGKDLEVYRNHPAHQAVVKYILDVTSDRIVTDYMK